MNSYISFAILAWSLIGLAAIIEKVLMKREMKDPSVLATYTGLFAVFPLLLFLPFAKFSTLQHFLFDLFCGAIFFCGLWLYFKALQYGDVSEALPLSGALTPIFSLLVSRFGLGMSFSPKELIAFAVLVLGILLISFKRAGSRKLVYFAVASAVLLAVYYALVKEAYQPFLENFAFVRSGSIVMALIFLLNRNIWNEVKSFATNKTSKGSFLLLSKEVTAGLGFLIVNYAISIGNPALVNALQGVEYAFVFLAALLLSFFLPRAFKEDFSKKVFFRKTFAVCLIVFGILILHS